RVRQGKRRIHGYYSTIPSARSTPLLSLRLPTTVAAGNGDSLARLGVTTTPSARARSGYCRTSMISSRKLPFKCSLQIASRLATARSELGPLSVMYSTIATAAVAAGSDGPRSFLLRAIGRLRLVLLTRIPGTVGSVTLLRESDCSRRRTAGHIRAANPAQRFLPVTRGNDARLIVAEVRCQLVPLPLQIMFQDLDPRTRVRLGDLQRHSLLIELGATAYLPGSLLVLLFPAQGTHQHLASCGVYIRQHRTGVAEDQFAHLVRVRSTPRFDDGQRP